MAIQDRLGSGNNRSGASKTTMDVRNKLVQKNRQNFKDARERLGQITKTQGDARDKLNKANKKRSDALPLLEKDVGFVPRLYNNLGHGLQKKLVNYVQAKRIQNNARPNPPQRQPVPHRESNFPRGKTSMNSGALTRTVSTGSRERVRRQEPSAKVRNTMSLAKVKAMDRRERAPARIQVKEIVREKPIQRLTMKQARPRQIREPVQSVSRSSPWATAEVRQRPVMKQRTQRVIAAPPQPEYVIMDEWDSAPVSNGVARKRTVYHDEDTYEYVPAPAKKPSLSPTIVSRLDEKPQMSFSQGYKILISNLHQTVTLEDVEELFGNIGPLSSVQMIGTGMAEVIFLKKDDAYKAIEVYHYRLLDGQPMNVSVVSAAKRPLISQPYEQQHQQQSRPTQYYQPAVMQSRPVVKTVLKGASGSTARFNRPRPAMYSTGGFF